MGVSGQERWAVNSWGYLWPPDLNKGRLCLPDVWVIKQNFCDWAVGPAKVCGTELCHLLLPELWLMLSSSTVFSLFLRGFHFLVVSSCGLQGWDRYVHPVSGNSVWTWWERSAKFFGAELWDFFLCLFSFANKRCQKKILSLVWGAGVMLSGCGSFSRKWHYRATLWNALDHGVAEQNGYRSEVRVAAVSEVFNGLLKTSSWRALNLAALEL